MSTPRTTEPQAVRELFRRLPLLFATLSIAATGFSLGTCRAFAEVSSEKPRKPNIVVILSDDK